MRERLIDDISSELVGKIPCDINVNKDSTELTMEFMDGSKYVFRHEQDCCEQVNINDVNGDWNDLIGQSLTLADERTHSGEGEEEGELYKNSVEEEYYLSESWTWTFYAFASVKGYVDVRWFGSSNGYYSEAVDCFCIQEASSA